MKSKKYSENIIKVFKKGGFVLSEPDVLLDSDYIIQRSGENFRKLMLTFEDDSGKSICLRPDLTVASCIKYLNSIVGYRVSMNLVGRSDIVKTIKKFYENRLTDSPRYRLLL